MTLRHRILIALATLSMLLCRGLADTHADGGQPQPCSRRLLPARVDGRVSIEHAMHVRRSIREYAPGPLALTDLSQLLWAAQGVTDDTGLRTTPSAGALYPLEVYVIAGDVAELTQGVYHYQPRGHTLQRIAAGDKT